MSIQMLAGLEASKEGQGLYPWTPRRAKARPGVGTVSLDRHGWGLGHCPSGGRGGKAPRLARLGIHLISVGLLLAAAGCDTTEPYKRIGAWNPNGANDTNLLAMVASPSDLVRGVGDGRGNAQMAAAAVDRLRRDAVKPLPMSGISQITATGAAGTPATPASPAAGGEQ